MTSLPRPTLRDAFNAACDVFFYVKSSEVWNLFKTKRRVFVRVKGQWQPCGEAVSDRSDSITFHIKA